MRWIWYWRIDNENELFWEPKSVNAIDLTWKTVSKLWILLITMIGDQIYCVLISWFFLHKIFLYKWPGYPISLALMLNLHLYFILGTFRNFVKCDERDDYQWDMLFRDNSIQCWIFNIAKVCGFIHRYQ